jgi:hypothetical protein
VSSVRRPHDPDKPSKGLSDAALDGITARMRRVEEVVGHHFPDVLDPLKAVLAVHAVGCLADNRQPITFILVGRSGAGKTMAIDFLMPADESDELGEWIYRSDKLTTASFVSHRADLTPEQLRQVDLLPRIRGKTMLSKELAPLFAGKRDELLERFATIASVLDGSGLLTDSGAHGRRGPTLRSLRGSLVRDGCSGLSFRTAGQLAARRLRSWRP